MTYRNPHARAAMRQLMREEKIAQPNEDTPMQTITSAAGTRLARAKARRDKEQLEHCLGGDNWTALREARHEFTRAAEALADELMAQGFHRMEGNDG